MNNSASQAILWLGLAALACQGDLGDKAGENSESGETPRPPSGEGDGNGAPPEAEPPVIGEEFSCDPAIARPGDNLVRRLTQDEYASTVFTALGVDISDESTSIPDLPPTERNFNNNSIELTVTRSHVDEFADLAESITSRIPGPDDWVQGLSSCSEYSDGCEETFINGLALKLYRAPVGEAELEALTKVFAEGAAQELSFTESALFVAQAMLQSPRFLYRVENEVGDGGVRSLNGYELASRLSYAVWGTSPDDELLEAAANGSLESDSGLATQVDRLIADPRFAETAIKFLGDWFDLHRLETFVPSSEEFPDFSPDLLPEMRAETEAAFRHVLESELPLTALFNIQQTTVSRELAEFYGLPDPQDGKATYDLTAISERGGILTQGALHSIGGNESSTVRRGLFFLYQVLCGSMSPPPEGVDTTPPPLEPGKSVRDVSQERVGSPGCGGCHSQFEPLVWGLVPFDATGTFHATDHHGNPLPADGYVVFPGTAERVDYATVGELMSALAESDRVRDCATLQSFEYLMGRPVANTDSCSLETTQQRIVKGTSSYSEMLRAHLLSPNFRMIQTEEL